MALRWYCSWMAIDRYSGRKHTIEVDLIVTQHEALVEYLRREYGIRAPAISHATAADVMGKVVIGVLPLYLAAYAEMVITIPLHTPPSLRNVELTADQVTKYAGIPRAYVVIDTTPELSKRNDLD